MDLQHENHVITIILVNAKVPPSYAVILSFMCSLYHLDPTSFYSLLFLLLKHTAIHVY